MRAGGRGGPAKGMKEEGDPKASNDSAQPSMDRRDPVAGKDAAGLLHLLLINHFFQTLD